MGRTKAEQKEVSLRYIQIGEELEKRGAYHRDWARSHPKDNTSVECPLARAERAYRKRHPKDTCGASRRWRKAHPQEAAERSRRRKALKRGATIGPIDIEAIKIRDKMRCCICGRKVNEKLKHPHPDSLSFDHSHPLSLGGSHSQNNLRVAHLHCNLKRHTGILPIQMVLC